MEQTTFVQPGTLVRPGPIGRTVRLLLGLWCCYAAAHFVESLGDFLHRDVPPTSLFIGPAFAFWLLPPVVNLGWGVNWKNRSQLVFLVLCGVAVLADFGFYGAFWGPPLGFSLWVATVYTLGHLGISFLLAVFLATPGCEMRAIPDLAGRLRGHSALEHHCPGPLTPLDNWEARRRS